ncbi:hypothetical protein SAMN05428988_2453 [Chitinophaga sp. YR573]|uniref:hypothetical protein n=1 Tax=Chitinophaga sp. YR573 TaxID=1881040 RepID=UPI0008D6E2EC|nr:hypothetical protein [Chitinophaga sp. YR573]SEW14418.1 hypothetical protein SAMN05428988_2453 [Chitinophaga sp. YR573]
MKKYGLFVVFHQDLKRDYYDPSLLSSYIFVNVNPKNEAVANYKDYKIINQYEFNQFHSLGKWYTESEVIYNIYKNAYLYEDLDYLGFLQHDIDSSVLTASKTDDLLTKVEHVNFQPYLFSTDYNQKILMDSTQPNKKNGSGLNCYDVILEDYNAFYKTNYKLSDLSGKTINLCASFILPKETFKEMMQFISSIIESGKLDNYDTLRQFRMQGGYLERYYAVWLAFKELQATTVGLVHHFERSTVQDSLLSRVLRKIGIRR